MLLKYGNKSTHFKKDKAFIVLHSFVHIKSNRNSCVKDENRERDSYLSPCLYSTKLTDESMKYVTIQECWFQKVTEIEATVFDHLTSTSEEEAYLL